MAYDATELKPLLAGMSGQHFNLWIYDTVDAISTVRVDAYFSDGVAKGMNIGDLVLCRVWGTSVRSGTLSAASWLTVLSKGTAAVDVSDGLAVTLTDSD